MANFRTRYEQTLDAQLQEPQVADIKRSLKHRHATVPPRIDQMDPHSERLAQRLQQGILMNNNKMSTMQQKINHMPSQSSLQPMSSARTLQSYQTISKISQNNQLQQSAPVRGNKNNESKLQLESTAINCIKLQDQIQIAQKEQLQSRLLILNNGYQLDLAQTKMMGGITPQSVMMTSPKVQNQIPRGTKSKLLTRTVDAQKQLKSLLKNQGSVQNLHTEMHITDAAIPMTSTNEKGASVTSPNHQQESQTQLQNFTQLQERSHKTLQNELISESSRNNVLALKKNSCPNPMLFSKQQLNNNSHRLELQTQQQHFSYIEGIEEGKESGSASKLQQGMFLPRIVSYDLVQKYTMKPIDSQNHNGFDVASPTAVSTKKEAELELNQLTFFRDRREELQRILLKKKKRMNNQLNNTSRSPKVDRASIQPTSFQNFSSRAKDLDMKKRSLQPSRRTKGKDDQDLSTLTTKIPLDQVEKSNQVSKEAIQFFEEDNDSQNSRYKTLDQEKFSLNLYKRQQEQVIQKHQKNLLEQQLKEIENKDAKMKQVLNPRSSTQQQIKSKIPVKNYEEDQQMNVQGTAVMMKQYQIKEQQQQLPSTQNVTFNGMNSDIRAFTESNRSEDLHNNTFQGGKNSSQLPFMISPPNMTKQKAKNTMQQTAILVVEESIAEERNLNLDLSQSKEAYSLTQKNSKSGSQKQLLLQMASSSNSSDAEGIPENNELFNATMQNNGKNQHTAGFAHMKEDIVYQRMESVMNTSPLKGKLKQPKTKLHKQSKKVNTIDANTDAAKDTVIEPMMSVYATEVPYQDDGTIGSKSKQAQSHNKNKTVLDKKRTLLSERDEVISETVDDNQTNYSNKFHSSQTSICSFTLFAKEKQPNGGKGAMLTSIVKEMPQEQSESEENNYDEDGNKLDENGEPKEIEDPNEVQAAAESEGSEKKSESSYHDSVNSEEMKVRREKKAQLQALETKNNKYCGKQYIKRIEKFAENFKASPNVIRKSNGLYSENYQSAAYNDDDISKTTSFYHNHGNALQSTNQNYKHVVVKNFTDEMKQEVAFFNMCKQATKPKEADQEDKDPVLKFYKECTKDHVVVYPILNKIKDQVLSLRSYKLNNGICNALENVFAIDKNLFTKVYLESNGIDSKLLQNVLNGFLEQEKLKTLAITENEIDLQNVQSISKMISKKHPSNLEELRIINCRIGGKICEELIKGLQGKSFLRKLSLVKSGLNEFSMKRLAAVIKSSRTLVELDISWNQLVPYQMKTFMQNLGKNRRIQNLNLAWNNLEDLNITDQEKREANQKDVLLNLGRLIKYNKNLIHLNLSNTNLSEMIVRELGTCLRRARSIVALHISGNPGLNESSRKYLNQRIRCQDPENMERFIRIHKIVQKINQGIPMKNKRLLSLHSKQLSRHQNQIKGYDPCGNMDKLIFQRYLGHKTEMFGSGQWVETSNDTIKSQYHQLSNCWICEKHVYGILFWSRQQAMKIGPVCTKYDAERLREELDKDEIDTGLMYSDGNRQLEQSIPHVAASFTNWRYKKMIKLTEFNKMMDKNYLTPLEICKNTLYVRDKINKPTEMNKTELSYYTRFAYKEDVRYTFQWPKMFKNFLQYKNPFLVNAHEFKRQRNEEELQQKQVDAGCVYSDFTSEDSYHESQDEELQKQKKALAEKKKKEKENRLSDESSEDEEQEQFPPIEDIYVLPFFSKPGQQMYMVKHVDKPKLPERLLPKDYQPKLTSYVYNCIVPYREEDVPLFSKKMKQKIVERVFTKEMSVFKDWRQDTKAMKSMALTEDFKHWKIFRFVKDETDRKNCEKIIDKYYEELKKIYISEISKSTYPNLGWIDYSNYVERCKILDNNVKMATVDRIFIASNVDLEDLPNNPNNALCRFEYWEVLVRIAQVKYKDPGICTNFADSLEKLIQECIIPNSATDAAQNFREQQLWTLDVNDVIEANLANLRKCYTHYITQMKKIFTYEDAVNLFMKDSGMNMNEKDVTICFGMIC